MRANIVHLHTGIAPPSTTVALPPNLRNHTNFIGTGTIIIIVTFAATWACTPVCSTVE